MGSGDRSLPSFSVGHVDLDFHFLWLLLFLHFLVSVFRSAQIERFLEPSVDDPVKVSFGPPSLSLNLEDWLRKLLLNPIDRTQFGSSDRTQSFAVISPLQYTFFTVSVNLESFTVGRDMTLRLHSFLHDESLRAEWLHSSCVVGFWLELGARDVKISLEPVLSLAGLQVLLLFVELLASFFDLLHLAIVRRENALKKSELLRRKLLSLVPLQSLAYFVLAPLINRQVRLTTFTGAFRSEKTVSAGVARVRGPTRGRGTIVGGIVDRVFLLELQEEPLPATEQDVAHLFEASGALHKFDHV